jgi:hypothetical protein
VTVGIVIAVTLEDVMLKIVPYALVAGATVPVETVTIGTRIPFGTVIPELYNVRPPMLFDVNDALDTLPIPEIVRAVVELDVLVKMIL